MATLKHPDMRTIEGAFQSDPGYVLNFSDRTFAEFFTDEFSIDIDDVRYRENGGSKMNRLRTFFRTEPPAVVARVMRGLWSYRESAATGRPIDPVVKARLFELIARIEATTSIARTDAIERFSEDETLDELVAAIERDMQADRPVAALDRLHTYCAKKFGHLLDQREIVWDRDEPLHSRVGKYVKASAKESEVRDMSLQIIKNAIAVFEKFNHIRNNQSLAHDNELISSAEARFIFDSVSAILRFIKTIDGARFEK